MGLFKAQESEVSRKRHRKKMLLPSERFGQGLDLNAVANVSQHIFL
jgi:hypothetical protein